jgi:DNA polymerase
MVIGEAPARRELENQKRDPEHLGRPLVGDSGQEYDAYLKLAGLDRESVYTTNISKCTDKSISNPSMEQARTCAEFHLYDELRRVRPEVIITLGAISLHTLFPGHNLEMEHGLPFYASWGSWEGYVIPMYHPAAGLHGGGRFMSFMRDDWERLNGVSVLGLGSLRAEDEYPSPDYRECATAEDVIEYMERGSTVSVGGTLIDLAIDTETVGYSSEPFCLSFSHTPGTARVIRAHSRGALSALNSHVQRWGCRVILHNAGFDPPVLRRMGIDVRPGRFDDTMMMAYHLGYLSQSLKILAYRLCGMKMMEFEDVAGPPSKQAVAEWLSEACEGLQVPPCRESRDGDIDAVQMIPADFPGLQLGEKLAIRKRAWKEKLASLGQDLISYRGKPVSCRQEDAPFLPSFVKFVNSLKTGNERALLLARNLLVSLIDSPEDPDVDPWSRFDGWNEDVRRRILSAATRSMPELSIANVEWKDALYYSARDADATIRILPVLRRMTKGRGRGTL